MYQFHSIIEKSISLRHELHRHPELSMQETWTKEYLMQFLRDNTNLEIVDRGKWFYAVYRVSKNKCVGDAESALNAENAQNAVDTGNVESATKNIAFRADFDAVPVGEDPGFVSYCSENPGVGHKCGHDGHSAALVAFAMLLDRCGAKNNIFLLFQHAEETGQGAVQCLPFLEENKIDEIYAVHNMPGLALGAVAVAEGVVQYASVGVISRFKGRKSHACYPEDGLNPSYAIAEIISELESLRKKQPYRGLTMITIIGVNIGERAFGTSAGEGELLLTVRGEHEEELQDLIGRIDALARQRADAHRLTYSVSYEDEFADCFNHHEAVVKVREAAERAGIVLQDLKEPFRASEDFGRFTKQVPGAIFYVGAGEEHAALHTKEYDFPDEIIETIVRMYEEISLEPAHRKTIELTLTVTNNTEEEKKATIGNQ